MRLRLTCTCPGPDREDSFMRKDVFGASLQLATWCSINGREFGVVFARSSRDGSEYAHLRPINDTTHCQLLREGWRTMLQSPFWEIVNREKYLAREDPHVLWMTEGF